MDVRYVCNDKGEKKAVILPIELWKGIKDKVEKKAKKKEEKKREKKGLFTGVWKGIKDRIVKKGKKEENKEVFTPSECRGIYEDVQMDPRNEPRSLREKWNRNI